MYKKEKKEKTIAVDGVKSIGPNEPNRKTEFKKAEEEMPNSILDYSDKSETIENAKKLQILHWMQLYSHWE